MRCAAVEELGQRNLPTRKRRPAGRVVVFVAGNPDRRDGAFRGVHEAELVEVAVLPAHGVLHGDMQVPERVARGHLDAAPYERVGLVQDDEELPDGAGARGPG